MHCWPAPTQVAAWQVPVTCPGGTTQPRPGQQSEVAVQVLPCGWQLCGGAHTPSMQNPEQQSAEVTQPLPLATQAPHTPPTHCPEQQSAVVLQVPPVGWQVGPVGTHTSGPPSCGWHVAPVQQTAPGPQGEPGGTQEETVHRSTPPASGRQSASLQHCSRNWQMSLKVIF